MSDDFHHDHEDRQAFRLMTWVFSGIFALTFAYAAFAISTRHGADEAPVSGYTGRATLTR